MTEQDVQERRREKPSPPSGRGRDQDGADQGDRGQGQLGYRLSRLWSAAELRRVPLRTIITAIVAVVVFFLAGKVLYRLKDVLLLLLVAGFLALILSPVVRVTERYVVKRRGPAVAVVGVLVILVFLGLSVAFGYPLVNAITHLADNLPSYVTNAEHGKGWVGKLVQHYHVQQWVQQNSTKLATFGESISAPALAVGKAAGSLLIELITIFILVLLLLLEGPRLRRGILSLLSPGQAEEAQAVASEVNRSVIGYMLGNFLTSVIAGIVVLVDLAVLGVPFPLLWGLWVALVDFLPMIGGALAGIPVIIFAVFHSVTAGIVTLIVFLVYTQLENHILNPVIMSKTVRISPLLVLTSVLVAASLGDWVGGLFGGFVAALLAIPAAGAFQVVVREAWQLTAPPAERQKKQQAVIEAAGDGAQEARQVAEEGGRQDAAEPDVPEEDSPGADAVPAGHSPGGRPG
ncbi:MAG TPA: AI-2E family transporter [Trebonia sp.]